MLRVPGDYKIRLKLAIRTPRCPLKATRGSVKLISSKLTSLMSLEQFQLKPHSEKKGYCFSTLFSLSAICDWIAPMTHSYKLGGDELHRPPVVALKQAVLKPSHINNLCHWFVNLKVNCCYKRALIG